MCYECDMTELGFRWLKAIKESNGGLGELQRKGSVKVSQKGKEVRELLVPMLCTNSTQTGERLWSLSAGRD